ncbi:MAG: class I SAM-dependent methyltransferase [Panacagrimonas sp.]
MRKALSKVPGVRFVYDTMSPLYLKIRNISHAAARRRIIADYTRGETRKLHIGCGHNVMSGWLNSDYYPRNPQVIHLDATKRFPLSDSSFDYVFSEHMIEHVPHAAGLLLLGECNRILKSGGKIRISTPNLRFLVELYAEEKSALQADYIQWASQNYIKNGIASESMVINNFVRNWGHQFIYDEKTLRLAMEASGFVDIVPCAINQSEDPVLSNLENEKRMPAGFLQLESLTLEGRKP